MLITILAFLAGLAIGYIISQVTDRRLKKEIYEKLDASIEDIKSTVEFEVNPTVKI